MDTMPLGLAFSRLGASVAGRGRPLCALAADGSLVMVCLSTGFTRPGPGVLRYSARLSTLAARRTQIEGLREGLDAARSNTSAVRLIIHTPASGREPGRIHARADLVGSLVEFDGDAFCVDFSRPEEVEEPPARSTRRKR